MARTLWNRNSLRSFGRGGAACRSHHVLAVRHFSLEFSCSVIDRAVRYFDFGAALCICSLEMFLKLRRWLLFI